MPPTERKGRVHTSTVTVAVIDPTHKTVTVDQRDLKIEWYSGTGCGGQNRNKVKTSCRITHIPTGIIRTSQTRSRTNSYALAYAEVVVKVEELFRDSHMNTLAATRKGQVGSGQRGDKVRTIRFQDNTAVDHNTGKRITADKYLKGCMNELWL